MKVIISDSLDDVLNENVVTQLVTNQQSDQLHELLERLFATKNLPAFIEVYTALWKRYCQFNYKGKNFFSNLNAVLMWLIYIQCGLAIFKISGQSDDCVNVQRV